MKYAVKSLGLLLALGLTTVQAGERVPLPADYAASFTEYLSLDRTLNPDQFIRLLANDIAMQGKNAQGQMPHGSVIVAEVYSVKKDEHGQVHKSRLGRRVKDKLKLIAVMKKGEGFAKTSPSRIPVGDWDFAAYKPNGESTGKNLEECRGCHTPLAKEDFLFSFDHLPQAPIKK